MAEFCASPQWHYTVDDASIAQWTEQSASTRLVEGSNPSGGAFSTPVLNWCFTSSGGGLPYLTTPANVGLDWLLLV